MTSTTTAASPGYPTGHPRRRGGRGGSHRRAASPVLAAALVAAVLAGCSSAPASSPVEVTPDSGTPTTTGSTTGSTTEELVVPEVELHQPPPWRAGPGEVEPSAKETATAFVEAVGTWDRRTGDQDAAAVARRVATGSPQLLSDGVDGQALAGSVDALVDSSSVAATTGIVYPQYGGLTADRASVMVVATQQLLDPAGNQQTRQLTLDVRMSRADDDSWRVAGIADPLPHEAPAELSDLAVQVLATETINLPEAARADIETGLVDDAVLATLLGMAAEHTLDVAVVRTGHPANVFETDRISNHTRYRGVDLWRIDGHLLADPAMPKELVDQTLRLAGSFGATEVGGPVDYNGDSPGWFTDQVHQDHIHIGVSPGRPPLNG